MSNSTTCQKLVSFAALGFVAVLGAGAASAGPFGLNKGDPMSKLESLGFEKSATAGIYHLKSVPKPHAQFTSYSVIATPEDGVCKVMAIAPSIETNVYGDAVKEQFKTIHESLTAKYGKAQDFDYLRTGSIWNEPKDWMTGLLRNERTLTSFWTDGKMPDGLTSVSLAARARNRDTGTIALMYEFDNFDSCKAKMKEKEDAPL